MALAMGVSARLGQLRLLMWKNWLLTKRQPVVFFVEVFWPLILAIVLIIIRAKVPGNWKDPMKNIPRAMPSAGYIPWMQTLVCREFGSSPSQSIMLDDVGFPNLTFTPATALVNALQALASTDAIDWTYLNEIPGHLVNLSDALQDPNFYHFIESNSAANQSLLFSLRDQNVSSLLTALQKLNFSFPVAQSLLNASVNWAQLFQFIGQDSNNVEVQQAAEERCKQLPARLVSACLSQVNSSSLVSVILPAVLGSANQDSLGKLLDGSLRGDELALPFEAANLTADNVRPIFCNPEQFRAVFSFPNGTNVTTVESSLCHLSNAQLTDLLDVWLNDPHYRQVLLNVSGLQGDKQFIQLLGDLYNDVQFFSSIFNVLGAHSVDIRPLIFFIDKMSLEGGFLTNYNTELGRQRLVQHVESFLCNSYLPVLVPFNGSESNYRLVADYLYYLLFVKPLSPSPKPDDDEPSPASDPTDDSSVPGGGYISDHDLELQYAVFNEIVSRLLNGNLRVLYTPDVALVEQIFNTITAPQEEFRSFVQEFNLSYWNFSNALHPALLLLNSSLDSPAAVTFLHTYCPMVVRGNLLNVSWVNLSWVNKTFPGAVPPIVQWRTMAWRVCIGLYRLRYVFGQDPFGSSSTDKQGGAKIDRLPYNETLFADLNDFDASVRSFVDVAMVADVRQTFVGCESEDELVGNATGGDSKNLTVLAGVVFTNINSSSVRLPEHVVYKIRQDESMTASTNWIHSRYWQPGACMLLFCRLNEIFGFNYIQDLVDRAIRTLQLNLPLDSLDPGGWIQNFPYPCYLFDTYIVGIAGVLPVCMFLSWVLTVGMLIKNIVYEKEQRLKEVMKVMGLENTIHWVAWFFNSLFILTLSVTLLTITLKYGQVLRYSNVVIIWLYLFLFAISTIFFCFLVSVFFSRANLAACCGGIIFFACFLPYLALLLRQNTVQFWQKSVGSLLAPTAFALSAQYVSYVEQQKIGLQWSNVKQSPIAEDDFSFHMCMVFLVIDSLLYMVLAWYLDHILPGRYGIPRKFYFPFQISYWLGDDWVARKRLRRQRRTDQPEGRLLTDDSVLETENDEGAASEPAEIHSAIPSEAEPGHLRCSVAIHNLVKTYDREQRAVDELSLNFYEGQITSFLGHNGAGKTTTMSILTGLFPPSSGTVYVHGQDIRTDIDRIRSSLGFCPQHNVLFNRLTVSEHLRFYALMKGFTDREIDVQMESWLIEVGLSEKRDCLACHLSGGTKRKLSVAIAFVGGSRTVVLDEPTAGVDPYARRGIWDMLLQYRNQGRTIILSTHHMDEADVLGDRIAIISHGKLRCVGSSLFLKSQYGEGYRLTMVKERQNSVIGSPVSSQTLDDRSDVGFHIEPAITKIVRGFVGEAELLGDIGAELTYRLPSSGAQDGSFRALFDFLDANIRKIGIVSYGVADTSLEEVFLTVSTTAEEDEDDLSNTGGFSVGIRRFHRKVSPSVSDHSSSPASDEDDDNATPSEETFQAIPLISVNDDQTDGALSASDMTAGGGGSYRVTGWRLHWQRFHALLAKRFHHFRRNRKGFLAQVVIPAFLVFIALLNVFTFSTPTELPEMKLLPSIFDEGKFTPFKEIVVNGSTRQSQAAAEVETIRRFCGISTEHFWQPAPFNISQCYSNGLLASQDYRLASFSNFTFPHGYNSSNPNSCMDCTCKKACNCTGCGCYVCPDLPPECSSVPPHMEQALVAGGSILQALEENVTLDNWILRTQGYYIWKRWGGVSSGGECLTVVNSSTQQPFLNRLAVKPAARAWNNINGYHSSAIYLNVLDNALLRGGLTSDQDPVKYGITTINHPFKKTALQLTTERMKSGVDFLNTLFIIFALSFVPASYVLFLINERVSAGKHLQCMAGVTGWSYWLSTFLWDLCNYLITVIILFVIFFALDHKMYISKDNFPAALALLLLYGWSVVPLMYPASFFFRVPSTAYVFLVAANVLIGIFATMTTHLLQVFANGGSLSSANTVLRGVLLVFPNYCMGRGLIDLSYLYYDEFVKKQLGVPYTRRSPFGLDIDQVGRNIISMMVSGFVFFALTLALEYNLFSKMVARVRLIVRQWPFNIHPVEIPEVIEDPPCSAELEDDDVLRERHYVLSGLTGESTIVLKNFTKVYGTGSLTQRAVDDLCLSVPAGECFGLLGVNGAGKTSTFKMLTGEETITHGEAFLNNLSVLSDKHAARREMGYCPQFDAIDDLITGREHLMLYARLRGVPEEECAKVVEWAVDKLTLAPYADRPSGGYSGGNKRKLSTAMAIIGKPPVIFLDEPTTGMDPKARRFLWSVISGLAESGHCIILTSHSMEECEALCQRLAIMVNGRFVCLGSPQHLKSKFGDGYTLTLRLTGSNPDQQPVKDFCAETFPGCVLQDEHHNLLQYELAHESVSLSHVFSELEAVRRRLGVEDYSVSQTTLDQVFIGFAKDQAGSATERAEARRQASETSLRLPQRALRVVYKNSGTVELLGLAGGETVA